VEVIDIETFDEEEYEYLEKLKTRNKENDFRDQTKPLTEPLDPKERELREMICEKCNDYLTELALAEFCGVLPSEKMKESGFQSVIKAIEKIKWGMTLQQFEH
jgi:O6-methylguanine-DNA--protein-cysteine methyltransferase